MLEVFVMLAAALLPAAFLCIYIFSKDRIEKEPVSLLLKLLMYGAIVCIPVCLAEWILELAIDGVFPETAAKIASETAERNTAYYLYHIISNFIGVALVEELGKFAVVYWFTRRNKSFNSLFDGIIYCSFVSLGFAALENVFYVFSGGFGVAMLRAVLAVPGHMFYGVLMGYYYSMWHIASKIARTERVLKAKKFIRLNESECSFRSYAIKCLLIPIVAHAVYDFCCFEGSVPAVLFLFAFVVFLYVHCFRKIKKISRIDRLENDYVRFYLRKKYPHLSDVI